MSNRPQILATCTERDVANRTTEWICEGKTVTCTQHYSEEPWNLVTQQRFFCTVTLNRGSRPLDVATSSHASAVAAFVQAHWAGDVMPIVIPEYLV